VVRLFALHTIVGVAAGAILYRFVPGSVWWFMPLFAGLVLAIPLAYFTSMPWLGR
jgi:membrane glycosyltransferase